MKIAFIGIRGIPATYGGTETYVERISKYLASQGDEVVVYCKTSDTRATKDAYDKHYSDNIKRVEIPSIPTKHLDNISRSFLSTIHACFDRRIDVVQFNNVGPAIFSILPRLFGKKVVGAIRAIDSQREKWNPLAKLFLRFCDYITVTIPHATSVNSLAMKEYYFQKYGKDTIYIPNGLDIPKVKLKPDLISQWNLKEKNYILFAARLEPEKGCHTLIKAYEQAIAQTGSDIKLAIAGHRGFSNEYYNELVNHQNEQIQFLGHIDPDKGLEELFDNAYAFILPSSVEGMSNSFLSAMAHGIPTVVSDIPENLALYDNTPISEDLNGRPGLSFKLENADDLAEKLIYLINNPDEAEKRGQMLKEHVKENFALDTMCANTRKIYSDIVPAKNTRGNS